MANNLAEIEAALVNADKAGDAQAAMALAAEVMRLRSAKPSAPVTMAEKVAGSAPVRFAVGAAKPILGAAQAVANMTPYGPAVNEHLATLEDMTQRGRQASGSTGFDVADFAGQVASPVNWGIGKLIPMGGSTGALAAKGAGVGAAGGLMTPVTDRKEQGDFWEQKALQTGGGAIAGGIATPLLSKVAESAIRKLQAVKQNDVTAVTSALDARIAINEALAKMNVSIDDIPKPQYEALRKEVADALKQGKVLDPAARLRQQDFKALGLQATTGQLTRDPMQFAKERNVRGIAGVGEPLLTMFDTQNQKIQTTLQGLKGNPADEYTAGAKLADVLRKEDERLRKGVTQAYQTARESAGKDAEVAIAGLANDFADVVDRFGDKVPSGVRNQFQKYGMAGGTQTKLFTVEEADRLLKSINDNVGSDAATNKALGELRAAVKRSITQDSGLPDVFTPAREAAAKRFALQDAIPALEAAATGKTAPDDFVRKFVINGKTEEVKRLAELLRTSDKDAFNEARAQLGNRIVQGAFGENLAGDRLAAPERLAKILRDIGPEKIKAFYTPEELDTFKQVARVAAYINSNPSAAPVSSSNSNIASMALNYRGPLGSISPAVRAVQSLAAPISNANTVSKALKGSVPVKDAPLTPAQIETLSRILGAGGLGIGAAAAQ